MPKLVGVARSDAGLKRTENQDSFFLDESIGLYIVADGMGGAASGRLAGKLVAESVGEYVRNYVGKDTADAGRHDFFDRALTDRGNTLMQAVFMANHLVYVASHKEDENKGMGATLAAILQDDEFLLIVNVGDSRIYRYRNYTLDRLTIDHRAGEDPHFRNLVDPDSTMFLNMSNTLTRAMGVRREVNPDIQQKGLMDGDVYLLCSDGLTDMVEDPVIAKVLGLDRPIEKKAEDLIELALAGGGRDNVTVVLAQATEGRLKGLLKRFKGD